MGASLFLQQINKLWIYFLISYIIMIRTGDHFFPGGYFLVKFFLRTVATTLSPAANTASVMSSPKPLDVFAYSVQFVMSKCCFNCFYHNTTLLSEWPGSFALSIW